MDWKEAFIKSIIFRIDEKTEMVHKCMEQLEEDDLWKKPNGASNSMGNLILHLCGNITQYIISGLGNTEDIRERHLEFSSTAGGDKAAMLTKLLEVLAASKKVIVQVSQEALLKTYEVQGFQLTGIGILIHVTEHYAYHTGQMAFYTKLLKDRDLKFYDGINLNTKNN